MAKRIEWIDVAKGLLIFLVILGHSDIHNITATIINSFHMAAFFVLSGITYKSERLTLKELLIKKFRTLLVPYFIFASIMLIYSYLKKIVFGGSFNLLSGLISIILPISGQKTTNVYGLWFFPCLFLAEIIIYILLYIQNKTKNIFGVVFGYIIFCIGSYWLNLWINRVSIISILPIAVLYIGIGKIAQMKLNVLNNKGIALGSVSLIAFLVCVYWNSRVTDYIFDLSSMSLGVLPIYILSGLFGTIFLCSIAFFISKSKILESIGKDSMYYYGLHYEFIGVIEKIIPCGVGQAFVTLCILRMVVLFMKNRLYFKKRA